MIPNSSLYLNSGSNEGIKDTQQNEKLRVWVLYL
jgi:hypothetical protein